MSDTQPTTKCILANLAIGSALLCTLYSVMIPSLVFLPPTIPITFLEWEGLQPLILALSLALSLLALVRSYLFRHRDLMPVFIAIIGYVLFALGKTSMSEVLEVMLSTVGGCFVILAHYGSIKLIKSGSVQ